MAIQQKGVVTGEKAFHPSLRSPFFNEMLEKVNNGQLDKEELEQLLKSNEARFLELSLLARYVRLVNFGDKVGVRGVIEISNHCHNSCNYCGMQVQNKDLPRYRLQAETIIAIAKQIRQRGIKTIFLQSGDDEGFSTEKLRQIIGEIKKQTNAEVLLCLGERKIEDYSAFYGAGADAAIIKQETSDPELFGLFKPGGKMEERQELLKTLKKIGYRIGSGVIIFPEYSELCNDLSKDRAELISEGIVEQVQKCIVSLIRLPSISNRSEENMKRLEGYISLLPEIMPALLGLQYNHYINSLVNDILLMKEIGVDMASAAPFIPNEQSPMLNWPAGSLDLTLRFMVACRLVFPDASIPSVSALERVKGGREISIKEPGQGIYYGLLAGANVVTVNFTPPDVRKDYAIYSGNRADKYIVSFEKAIGAIERAGLKPDLSTT